MSPSRSCRMYEWASTVEEFVVTSIVVLLLAFFPLFLLIFSLWPNAVDQAGYPSVIELYVNIDRLTDWLTDWQMNGPTDWLISYLDFDLSNLFYLSPVLLWPASKNLILWKQKKWCWSHLGLPAQWSVIHGEKESWFGCLYMTIKWFWTVRKEQVLTNWVNCVCQNCRELFVFVLGHCRTSYFLWHVWIPSNS